MPLCPTGRGTVHSEIPAEDYDVVVFENRFPSFATEPTAAAPWVNPLFAQAPALGRCEVVCFTSDHDASFSSLSPARARTVVDAWADRTRALSALDVVEHVFVFENRGQEIGVTLHHPHGQIYAYPFLPARTAQVLRQATEHHERTGRLLGADLLAAELDAGSRVVIRGTHWTAYVPYAARWPVEVHLAPNRDVPDLVALDDDERDELAEVYLDLLRRLDRYYQGPSGSPIALPYIAGWHQAPVRQGRDVSRLHLQVMSVRPLDRLSDKQIRARAKHIVTEIERVRATVALLRSRRLPDVGPVFNASHASMRDDFEISCAELGLAVEVASAHDALGARMTGGGLGGSAITLVPTDSTAEVTSAVIQAFADKGFAPHCFPVTAASLPPTRTSGGQAGRFANRLAGGRFSLDDDADAIPDQT